MNSPTEYYAQQQRLGHTSPYFQIALYAGGQVLAVAILLLVWFSWGILAAFQEPLLWAWLCSLSLRDVKRFLVSTARRELLSSSFIVCCAKLVFLPAVIAWQLFEEVREKLQAKYYELQASNQVTSDEPVAGASGPTDGQLPAAAEEGGSSSTDAAASDGGVGPDGNATSDYAAAAAAPPSKGSQVLRHRKPPGKHHQQQQQRHQRPPLGPRPTASADGSAASGKQGSNTSTRKKAAAAAAAAHHGSSRHHSRKQPAGAGHGEVVRLTGPALHQRIARLQDLTRQLISGYGFITMELLRFILGGLLPRRSDAEQQQRQQQQQQQRQQTWPASGMTNSTLTAGSGPVHSVTAVRADGAASSSSYPASLMGSFADSHNSSCRSECNMPWTPHPHWQQLLLQQQQQQQQQQQHQQQLGLALQVRQQSARGLSSSASSPSLQSAVSRQLSPRILGAASAVGADADAASGAGVDPFGTAALDRHATVPVSGNSLSGWAALQVHPHTAPHQQQQLLSLSRCDSSTSCSTGQAMGPSGSAAPDAAALTAAAQRQQQLQRRSSAGGSTPPAGMQLPPPALSFSLPSQLPTPTAAPGRPLSQFGDPVMMMVQPCACESGSVQGTYWEGVGAGRSPPGSTTGLAVSAGDRSSPSAVLFKGLLRGIVLYEGYRFVRGFLAAEQSLFMPLLLLGATLAVAGGLPFLLLPASLLHTETSSSNTPTGSRTTTTDAAQSDGGNQAATTAAAGAGGANRGRGSSASAAANRPVNQSPFSEAASGTATGTTAAAGLQHKPPGTSQSATAAKPDGGISQRLRQAWGFVQQLSGVLWSWLVSCLVKVDTALRLACASSFLDTAASGLIVVGLILGSVVLSAVLLVQIGDESRQAVVSVNSLVRQKGTEAGLTEGVWSLVQQYEGQLVGMTQYVLQETLPGLTHYVESRASDFLISHNLSKVLIDWEVVRAALKLPADCGDEARLRLAVQLANSSLAEADLGRQRQQLQQQLDEQQQRLGKLAAEVEAAWMNSSSSSSIVSSNNSRSGNGSVLAQDIIQVQASVAKLQEELHSTTASYEAANEQLKLAELRLHNCQPTSTSSAAAAAAGLADAAQGRGLISSLLGGFTAPSKASAAGGTAETGTAAAGKGIGGTAVHGLTQPLSHVRGALAALARLDFTAAGSEAAAVLGQLVPHGDQEQLEGQQVAEGQQVEALAGRQLHTTDSCGLLEASAGQGSGEQQPLVLVPRNSAAQCSNNHTSPVAPALGHAPDSCSSPAAAGTQGGGLARTGSTAGSSSSSSTTPSTSSTSTRTSTSLVRVARGAAYPLITLLRHVSSVLVAGLGSTTAVALGTGLGMLRLGLGVAKFLVQLGVFASVLYTLLALDIDPVEQLLKLLPISEASQDRASRAVTKALRGVFVSSLKLAAFHAGFTWLTLRAFGTHFVCTATVASAIVAVLPLVPVYLAALPAVLELVLVRGAPVKGLVLLALHVGAYTFGDDLIYREIEPTLPYLVGLGVFGGMWHFANPLQGVLLGPMVLALLSVGYNLHREMY